MLGLWGSKRVTDSGWLEYFASFHMCAYWLSLLSFDPFLGLHSLVGFPAPNIMFSYGSLWFLIAPFGSIRFLRDLLGS